MSNVPHFQSVLSRRQPRVFHLLGKARLLTFEHTGKEIVEFDAIWQRQHALFKCRNKTVAIFSFFHSPASRPQIVNLRTGRAGRPRSGGHGVAARRRRTVPTRSNGSRFVHHSIGGEARNGGVFALFAALVGNRRQRGLFARFVNLGKGHGHELQRLGGSRANGAVGQETSSRYGAAALLVGYCVKSVSE